ncbi:MAG: Pycsar system effector family protein [Gilvibacter sp.]
MTAILEKTHLFVTELLQNKLSPDVMYHNLLHTKRVFKSAKEIVDNTSLSESEEEAVLIASLLHDIGYIEGWEDHEAKSVQLAIPFLTEQGVSTEQIETIKRCILATRMEHQPTDLLEEIIRDADASHFAKDYYQEACEYLRQELKALGIADYSWKKWTAVNIDMFVNKHDFYTDYAKANWQPLKEENLKRLYMEQQEIKEQKKKEKIAKIKAKIKDESPEKAVQSMYRVTLKNHIKLSDIADTKANILLSVNAIIISLALSNLIPKLDNPSNAYLIWPTLIFIVFSIVSMILSVLATRPNVTSGQFTKEDVTNKKVNLLFFGNFHKMKYEEFEWAMNEMINDKDYIYKSMTKDLYYLGLVLNRKYKILRLTYTVFIVGIVLSVISFAIAFQFAEGIRENM